VHTDVQLVCFDLGGVLLRICDGWQHACEVAGITVARRKLDAAVRGPLTDLMARADLGQLDLHTFAAAAGPLLGVQPEHVVAVSNAYLLGAYPGVEELLLSLADRGVATACLSNTNASHWRMMNDPDHPAALPLYHLTHRFASHLIGARKPDPAIYEHVEDVTGVPANAIVFFDDLAPNVEAAWQRGWRAVRVDPAGDPVATVYQHLTDLGVL
jgi:putative hydrolase of the HAD superfamily